MPSTTLYANPGPFPYLHHVPHARNELLNSEHAASGSYEAAMKLEAQHGSGHHEVVRLKKECAEQGYVLRSFLKAVARALQLYPLTTVEGREEGNLP